MRSIWVGIHPRPSGTRVLATTAGTEETLLKARLSTTPRHPRAVATLLEALALWQGQPVRAVVAVDGRGDGCGTSSCRQWFGADDETPLYTLDVVAARRPRRRDGLSGLGDFRDLERLLVRAVAR
jgi:hypothetical protein